MGEDFPYFFPLGRERIFVPSPNAVVNFLTVMSFPLEKEEKTSPPPQQTKRGK